MHRFRADPSLAGLRLAAAVARRVEGLSGRAAKTLVDLGRVFVDGRRATLASLRLRGGEVIEVHADRLAGGAPALSGDRILWQGRDFLAIDKPAGLSVYGTRGETAGTLLPELEKFLRATGSWRPGDRLILVHRLDRDTSGVLLVARTEDAAQHLERQFRQREVQKDYLALVEGNPKFHHMRCVAPVTPTKPGGHRTGQLCGGIREGRRLHRQCRAGAAARRDLWQQHGATGRFAETEFAVLRRFEGYALVEARPLTGRTHQIRIHLAHIGHPVLGDAVYGRRAGASPLVRSVPRQMLHAASLRFRNPDTGREMELNAPVPEDMQRFMEGQATRRPRGGGEG